MKRQPWCIPGLFNEIGYIMALVLYFILLTRTTASTDWDIAEGQTLGIIVVIIAPSQKYS